jgi:hypothetical protein
MGIGWEMEFSCARGRREGERMGWLSGVFGVLDGWEYWVVSGGKCYFVFALSGVHRKVFYLKF